MMTEEEWRAIEATAEEASRPASMRPYVGQIRIEPGLFLATYRELKQRREDEEWLKGGHLRRIIWDQEFGQFEVVWEAEKEGESYYRNAPTIHEAIEKAKGGKG